MILIANWMTLICFWWPRLTGMRCKGLFSHLLTGQSDGPQKVKFQMLMLFGILFKLCYITYAMNFRFVPSDPVCFDKLSRCD